MLKTKESFVKKYGKLDGAKEYNRYIKRMREANDIAAKEKSAFDAAVKDAAEVVSTKGKTTKYDFKNTPDIKDAEKQIDDLLDDFDMDADNENDDTNQEMVKKMQNDPKKQGQTQTMRKDIKPDEVPSAVKAQKEAVKIKEATKRKIKEATFDNIEDNGADGIETSDEFEEDIYSDGLSDGLLSDEDLDMDKGNAVDEDIHVATDEDSNSVTIMGDDDEDFDIDGLDPFDEGDAEADELEDHEEPDGDEDAFGNEPEDIEGDESDLEDNEEDAEGEEVDDLDIGDEEVSEEGIEKLQKESKERKLDFEKLLESVDKSIMTENFKNKLALVFDLAVEAKAKHTAAVEINKSVDHIAGYVDRVVEHFVADNKKQLKKAVNEAKRAQVYNKMKALVEATFGVKDVERYTKISEAYKAIKAKILAERANHSEVVKKMNEKIESLTSNLLFESKTSGLNKDSKDAAKNLCESFEYKDVKEFSKKLDTVVDYIKNKKIDTKKTVVENKTEKPATAEQKRIQESIAKKRIQNLAAAKKIEEAKDAGVIDPDEVGFYNM